MIRIKERFDIMSKLPILPVVVALLLVVRICYAETWPPPGFSLQKRKLVDQVAEREENAKRMREFMSRDVKERQQIAELSGGREAILKLGTLEFRRTMRERELLKPVEALHEQYKALLQEKLENDSIYQEHKLITEKAKEDKKNSETSVAFEKYYASFTDKNGRVPSRDELIALVRESEERPKLIEMLEADYSANQEIRRLQSKERKRRREIEEADTELQELKRQKRALKQEIESTLFVSDETLKQLDCEISTAKLKIEELKKQLPTTE